MSYPKDPRCELLTFPLNRLSRSNGANPGCLPIWHAFFGFMVSWLQVCVSPTVNGRLAEEWDEPLRFDPHRFLKVCLSTTAVG